ncbi:4-hydroxy-tetrahydrodipicolinate synthase [Sedimenticola selenatireducens]|uniref:4-hydroxy-tetrahydrodipicolinate synthase n=1 Tax=Sedimenticola selenatireducens TaxID=191960 RepID=A0A557SBP3_9GAMM|nr:4-hydroxy-tetrahydrodipicolinate synthase [Sedimenticola selenatireducens]TVO74839.1 4-hydroxy-tetrahydrodipicolinate synthase [Sedimenticola selenatireducens]TVT62374.1 MAG: 4-hydroxy-tetrahydrodipicolinate synthase [Sedimenticola selenatireducens]
MFQGSMVALVTPMREDGSVDENSLRALVNWHVEQGTDAIVAVGTTGESATLDEQEHCEVIRQVVSYTNKRVPVIAGTGANSTTEAIQLTRCAKEAGADGCLLVTPYYNKPTQEGLFQHFKAVAEAVDIPQLLYNVPGRTACDMLPETVGRLSAIKNIVGIKEATGQLDRVAQLKALCGGDFALITGDDATSREFILLGGVGTISVTANIAPAAMHQMITAARNGDADEAARIDATLAALHRDLFLESNPIPVKWALAEMGLIPKGIRLPLTWFAEAYQAPLRQSMVAAGIL